MTELLTAFGRAFAEASGVAMVAAFAWGALAVFLSPCHLTSIPLIVAYMNGGREPPSSGRAAMLATSFAVGTVGSTALVGAVTIAAGRIAGDVGRAGTYVLSAVFFIIGLNLVGLVSLPSWSIPSVGRRGPGGALLLGAIFGAALGPCAFAFMAPLLGVAFTSGQANAGWGALLVALYAIGHAVAIVVAGSSAQLVQRWLSWKVGARSTDLVRRLAGSAVIAAGIYFVWTAP